MIEVVKENLLFDLWKAAIRKNSGSKIGSCKSFISWRLNSSCSGTQCFFSWFWVSHSIFVKINILSEYIIKTCLSLFRGSAKLLILG